VIKILVEDEDLGFIVFHDVKRALNFWWIEIKIVAESNLFLLIELTFLYVLSFRI
jgi:hypothetical protein